MALLRWPPLAFHFSVSFRSVSWVTLSWHRFSRRRTALSKSSVEAVLFESFKLSAPTSLAKARSSSTHSLLWPRQEFLKLRRAASLDLAVLFAEAFAFPFAPAFGAALGGMLQAPRCPNTLKKQFEKKEKTELTI